MLPAQPSNSMTMLPAQPSTDSILEKIDSMTGRMEVSIRYAPRASARTWSARLPWGIRVGHGETQLEALCMLYQEIEICPLTPTETVCANSLHLPDH